MDDLSQLTDEELDKKIEETQEGVDESVPVSTDDDTSTDEVEEPAEPVEEAPAEPERTTEPVTKEESEGEKEAPREPSRRESLRIQQLLEKNRELSQQVQQPQSQTQPGLDYAQALDAEPETIQQLETDRRAFGQAQYQQGIEQAKSIQFHTRLEIDAPKVETKYPQLDKSSDKFDAGLADSINNEYLMWAGYDPSTDTVKNPNIRYNDFVEARMEQAERIASYRTEQTTKNIAKQAATTGLRPDGSSAKRLNLNQAPENMSDEELDAIIGQAIPSKKR